MSKFVLITGMHRSGTSAITGTLREAGLFVGNVDNRNPFNPKGNVENSLINQINERVLRGSGGSWMNPPFKINWNPFLIGCKNSILSNLASNEIYGIKDPRFCFTMEEWLKGNNNHTIIASFRSPIAVARSLEFRNKFPLEIGLDLWKKYNLNLLQLNLTKQINFIEYTGHLEKDYSQLSYLAKKLELNLPEKPSFYESNISNHSFGNNNFCLNDPEIEKIYLALQNKACKKNND